MTIKMIIDYEYISRVLNVFLESESSTVNFDSFSSFYSESKSQEKFIFHIEILQDKMLVISIPETGDLGITRSLQGDYCVSVMPWRLTADGHDFASAITKPAIMITIKEKFKKEGFSAVVDIAKKLAIKKAEKILDDL